jgi:hypothetical protein
LRFGSLHVFAAAAAPKTVAHPAKIRLSPYQPPPKQAPATSDETARQLKFTLSAADKKIQCRNRPTLSPNPPLSAAAKESSSASTEIGTRCSTDTIIRPAKIHHSPQPPKNPAPNRPAPKQPPPSKNPFFAAAKKSAFTETGTSSRAKTAVRPGKIHHSPQPPIKIQRQIGQRRNHHPPSQNTPFSAAAKIRLRLRRNRLQQQRRNRRPPSQNSPPYHPAPKTPHAHPKFINFRCRQKIRHHLHRKRTGSSAKSASAETAARRVKIHHFPRGTCSMEVGGLLWPWGWK